MVNKTIKNALSWIFDTNQKKGIPTNPEKEIARTIKEKEEEQNSTQQFIFQRDSIFIEDLDAIMEEYISDPKCKVKKLAKGLAQSYESLNNNVKRIKGCSLSKYFSSYRMNRAKELIENSKMSISEIAYFVGSSNLQTFSRSFKREFGISPRDLRKKK